jgi:protein required for attachment to host cells
MAEPQQTWVVIADGGGARIVARRPSAAAYGTVGRVPAALSHRFSHEIGSDEPGRVYESASTARHALQARHDPHRLEKEAFARRVANAINLAGGRGDFDNLILVAPPRILHDLKARLDQQTRAKLIATLAKDLTKIPDHELAEHLKPLALPRRG